MKKIVCFILCSLCLLTSACGGRSSENQEYVIRKDASDFYGYSLEETRLKSADKFKEDEVLVEAQKIIYEDVVTKIALKIKNDTDKSLKFLAANLSVNGLMWSGSLLYTAEAKTENEAFIEISNEWFSAMQIEMIDQVEFLVKVFNEKDDEIMQSGVLKIKTDAPSSYEQKYDDSGFEIYNEGGIRLLARHIQKSAHSDNQELVFYIENNTKSAISVMSDNVRVNGKKIEPLFVMSVGAGKKAVDTMVFYDADLKDINVKEIKSVGASFKAFNESLETVFETKVIEAYVS